MSDEPRKERAATKSMKTFEFLKDELKSLCRLESEVAEVCPEDTDIRSHVRLLQSLIDGHRAKVNELGAIIDEARKLAEQAASSPIPKRTRKSLALAWREQAQAILAVLDRKKQ